MRYAALPGQLELVVATVSEGLGAAMAYDVSVRSQGLTLTSPVDDDQLTDWRGEATIPIDSFIAYQLHRHKSGKLTTLSDSDAQQITTKTQKHLREAFGDTIRLTLTQRASKRQPELALTEPKVTGIQLSAEVRGARAPLDFTLSLAAKSNQNGPSELAVEGHGSTSLSSLGVAKVKAPLGLLVVADRVELTLRGVLTAQT